MTAEALAAVTLTVRIPSRLAVRWQEFMEGEATGHVEIIFNQGHVHGWKITDVGKMNSGGLDKIVELSLVSN